MSFQHDHHHAKPHNPIPAARDADCRKDALVTRACGRSEMREGGSCELRERNVHLGWLSFRGTGIGPCPKVGETRQTYGVHVHCFVSGSFSISISIPHFHPPRGFSRPGSRDTIFSCLHMPRQLGTKRSFAHDSASSLFLYSGIPIFSRCLFLNGHLWGLAAAEMGFGVVGRRL